MFLVYYGKYQVVHCISLRRDWIRSGELISDTASRRL